MKLNRSIIAAMPCNSVNDLVKVRQACRDLADAERVYGEAVDRMEWVRAQDGTEGDLAPQVGRVVIDESTHSRSCQVEGNFTTDDVYFKSHQFAGLESSDLSMKREGDRATVFSKNARHRWGNHWFTEALMAKEEARVTRRVIRDEGPNEPTYQIEVDKSGIWTDSL